MNLIDLVTTPYNTKIISQSQANASDTSVGGSQSNIYDHNTGTYYLYYTHHGGDGSVNNYLTFEVDWTVPTTIYQVYSNSTIQMGGGNYFGNGPSYVEFYVYLNINGTWTNLDGVFAYKGNGTQDGDPPYNYVRTLNGPWNNVTGARIYQHGQAYSYEGDRNQYIWSYINEFNVYREQLNEIFRIKKPSGTIRIGSQLLNGHALRMNKNGTTYGIPLLSTSDPQASPVRIRKGSTTYSLPLAD